MKFGDKEFMKRISPARIGLLYNDDIVLAEHKTFYEKHREYERKYGGCEVTTRQDEKWGEVHEYHFSLRNGEPYMIAWARCR